MWGNATLFYRAKSIEWKKYWEKMNIGKSDWSRKVKILTQLIEKSFLKEPLTVKNAIHCDSLTLMGDVKVGVKESNLESIQIKTAEKRSHLLQELWQPFLFRFTSKALKALVLTKLVVTVLKQQDKRLPPNTVTNWNSMAVLLHKYVAELFKFSAEDLVLS